MSSRLPGFYKTPASKRQKIIAKHSDIGDYSIFKAESLPMEKADIMVENAIGTFALPLAVAVNFTINNKDILIPMVVEEPSVVAAVSNMARLLRNHGGFQASSDSSIMIGQIHIPNVEDVPSCLQALEKSKSRLTQHAQQLHPRLQDRGGGLRNIHFRHVHYDEEGEEPEDMVVVHFHLDCVDAMGANMINTIAESLSPLIEEEIQASVGLKILSNYATERLSRAQCSIPYEALGIDSISGEDVAKRMASAYRFAYADPWRAATHNKGIMNGIDAVAIATGNDWRAIEAGAHAWASKSGQYRSLSRWYCADGRLHGSLALPIQVGTVGGSIKTHPQVAANLKILGNPRAQELSSIMAAVGLAQNMGALRALSTEGIQKGHMRMHARNIALQAGATIQESEKLVSQMSKAHNFSVQFAHTLLLELRKGA